MSDPKTLADLLADLDERLRAAQRSRWGAGDIGHWFDRNATFENASAIIDHAPEIVGLLSPTIQAPIGDFYSVGSVGMTFGPSPPEPSQWMKRYDIQRRATLLGSERAPRGWRAPDIVSGLASDAPWDRVWACSEVLRCERDDETVRSAVLTLLTDDVEAVRAWAWLCAVRWAERAPEAVRSAIEKAFQREGAALKPRAAWAAWRAGSSVDFVSAFRPLVSERPGRREVFTVLEWLGQVVGALADDVEELVDNLADRSEPNHDRQTWDTLELDTVVGALAAIAPERWQTIFEWCFAQEWFTPAPSRRRRPAPEVFAPRLVPTLRARAALSALEGLADRLDDGAVARIVERADDHFFLGLIGAIGPRARAAIPSVAKRAGHEADEVLVQLGAADELVKRSATNPHAISALSRIADPTPHLLRLIRGDGGRERTRIALDIARMCRAHDPLLIDAALQLLEAEDVSVIFAACEYLAHRGKDDEALLVRVASAFARTSATSDEFFSQSFNRAAEALAEICGPGLEGRAPLVAVPLIQALGWTLDWGRPHLESLRAVEGAASTTPAMKRSVKEAIARIEDPPPRFRPNS
jgi:hypothetical protein